MRTSITKRILATLLAVLITVGTMPLYTFATDKNDDPVLAEYVIPAPTASGGKEGVKGGEEGEKPEKPDNIISELLPEADTEVDYAPVEHTHRWNNATVTTPATQTATGVLTYTCSCGETQTRVLPRVTQSGTCGASVNWSLHTDGLLVISGTGAMVDYMPYNVPWDSYRASIRECVIAEGVTSIGRSACEECTGLTSITIPDSVTSIGYYAFWGCTGLTSIEIPNSVTTIGAYVFSGCTGLTSIEIPDSVTSIGNSVFRDCTGLTSIEIPNSVTNIGSYAFWGCTGLTSIEIPNSVTNIGGSAFQDCTGLTSIEIPNSVTNIGSYAFYGCTGLTSIEIPSGVTSIGSYAFRDCTGLTSIDIPYTVTSIDECAFMDCTSMTSITVWGFTSIHDFAFFHVRFDNVVYYGSSEEWHAVKSAFIFAPDAAPTILGVCSGGMGYESEQRFLVYRYPDDDADHYRLFVCGTGELRSVPNSNVGYLWFDIMEYITEYEIDEGVTSISEYSFQYLTGLESISIPSSVSSITNRALRECTALENITVAEGNEQYCSVDGVLFSKDMKRLVAYPAGRVGSYVIPQSVRSIGGYAFYGCTGLTSVTIPSGVTGIGMYAFYGCTGLTSVTIPSGVTGIAMYAFYGCTGLTSIEIPSGVTSIGEYAFMGCTGLTSVTIPSGVTRIYDYAFSGCTGLTSIEIPNSVTRIYDYAFSGCTGLTSIEIPNSVTSIDDNAFYGCTGLTSVTIPSGVTSIGASAFQGCTGLTEIDIPSGVTGIGESAFAGCASLDTIRFPKENTDVLTSIGADAIPSAVKIVCYTYMETEGEAERYAKANGNRYIAKVAEGSLGSIFWYAEKSVLKNNDRKFRMTVGGTGIVNRTVFASIGTEENHPPEVLYTGDIDSLVIERGITAIGTGAFVDMTALASVTIGKDVRNISGPIFNAPCLGSVYFLGDIPVFAGNLFSDTLNVKSGSAVGTTLYYAPSGLGWKGMDVFSLNNLEHDSFYPMPLAYFFDEILNAEGSSVSAADEGLSDPFDFGTYTFTRNGNTYGFYRIVSIGEMAVLNEGVDQQGIVYETTGSGEDRYATVVGYNSSVPQPYIVIPKSVLVGATVYPVTTIGADAFGVPEVNMNNRGQVRSIETITVSADITTIEDGAFSGGSHLMVLYFTGNKPTTVGTGLFARQPIVVHRSSAVWGEETTELDARVFTAVELDADGTKNGVVYEVVDSATNTAIVGSGRGNAYNNEANVNIEDFVYYNGKIYMVIGFHRYAFTNKENVQTVSFGEFIGYGETEENPAVWDMTFRGMRGLTSFTVAANNAYYSSVDGMLCGGRLDFDIMVSNGKEGDEEVFTKVEGRDTIEMATRLMFVPAAKTFAGGVLTVPEGVTIIERYAAYGNKHITSIDFGSTTVIGAHAFGNCSNLADTVDLEYVMFIEDYAFSETALTTLANTQNLKYIGKYAFSGKLLAEIRNVVAIGPLVDHIGEGAFAYNEGITAFVVDPENENFRSEDGVLFKTENGVEHLIQYPAGKAAITSYTVPENTVKIYPYAFLRAKIGEITVADATVVIGHRAFERSTVQTVTLGSGYRGEVAIVGDNYLAGSLYTSEMFQDCTQLENIFVSDDNPYYISIDGVLCGKMQGVNEDILYRFPAGKTENIFVVPEQIVKISDNAFRANTHIRRIIFKSPDFDYVGSNAFMDCGGLEELYFRTAEPPRAGEHPVAGNMSDNVTVYYPEEATEDWDDHWYDCPTSTFSVIRELGNDFVEAEPYFIVVTDTMGNPINGADVRVTLTAVDPAIQDLTNYSVPAAGDGIYSFAVFDEYFDGPCDFKVTVEEYFPYVNEGVYLDPNVPVTYVTLVKEPVLMGLSIDGEDINTTKKTLNLASFTRTRELLQMYENGVLVNVTDEAGQAVYTEEDVFTIKAACYHDISYSVVSSSVKLLQNGNAPLTCESIDVPFPPLRESEASSDALTVITFTVKASELKPNEPLRVSLEVKQNDKSIFMESPLNIDVIDVTIDEDDVELSSEDVAVDLENGSSTFATLFGGKSLNVNFGKNLSLSTVVKDDTLTVTLVGKYSKKWSYNSGKEAYGALTKGTRNENTFHFQFKNMVHTLTYEDSLGRSRTETINSTYDLRFVPSKDDPTVYYYYLYVYSGSYDNELASYYGVVNSKTGRIGLAPRAQAIRLIYSQFVEAAIREKAATVQDMDKAQKTLKGAFKNGFSYDEPMLNEEHQTKVTADSAFSASLSGSLLFKIEGMRPRLVSGEIKGTLQYTFSANVQTMVWVIPVTLEVEVNLKGEIVLKLRFDGDAPISCEEIRLQLEANLTARVGIGCKVASIGVYGKVGALFAVEFYPNLGVETFKINAELGAYAKVLWYTKYFPIYGTNGDVYIIGEAPTKDGIAGQNSLLSAFVVETYSPYSLESGQEPIDEMSKLFVYGGSIYKVGFINARTLNENDYDASNAIKLALWSYNNGAWEVCGLIDDTRVDGLSVNDGDFSLNGTMLCYTQQTRHLTDDEYADPYAAAEGLSLKTIDLAELIGGGATPTVVIDGSESSDYKYLMQAVEGLDGALYVAWAENAENNILGVSANNYLDGSESEETAYVDGAEGEGAAHIYETTANAVYVAKYEDGTWSKTLVADGLSTVTEIALTITGDVAYIVDGDSDPSTEDDRLLYSYDGTTTTAVNTEKDGEGKYVASVSVVYAEENDIVYYFYNGEERFVLTDGAATSAASSEAALYGSGDMVRVYDNGELKGLLFVAALAKEEDASGHTIYGIFRDENGEFGKPVAVVEAQAGKQVRAFTAVKQGSELVLSIDYMMENGGESVDIVTETAVVPYGQKITMSYTVDYEKNRYILTVNNCGMTPTAVYYSIGENGTRYALEDGEGEEVIASGETVEQIFAISEMSGNSVCLWNASEGGESLCPKIENPTFEYASLVPAAKHIVFYDKDVADQLIVSVANRGNLAASFNLDVYFEYSRPTTLEGDGEFMQSVSGVPAYSYSSEVGADDVKLFKIELDENMVDLDEGTVAVKVTNTSDNEPSELQKNNVLYVSLNDGSAVKITENGGEEEITRVYADENDENDIVLTWAGTVKDVETRYVSATFDGVKFAVPESDGAITLSRVFLMGLTPDEVHELELTFNVGGRTVKKTVEVMLVKHYTVDWVVGNTVVGVTEHNFGDIMKYSGATPEMEGTVGCEYVFAGWDMTEDGEVDPLCPANEDIVAVAVFVAVPTKHTVTWHIGGEIYTETYSYDSIPMCRVPMAKGATLTGWATEENGSAVTLTAVKGDVDYYALIHVYGEWISHNATQHKKLCADCDDVQYEDHAFDEFGVCSVCGYNKLRFTSASITMGNNLSMNYKVSVATLEELGFTNPYGVFTFNGETVTVTDYKLQSGSYVFTFAGILSFQLADNIEATLYAYDAEDQLHSSAVLDYSVAAYCYNRAEFSTNAKMRTLAVDILNYGTAAQVYFGYKVEEPINGALTPELAALASADVALTDATNAKFKTVESPEVTWKAVTLVFENSIAIRYKFESDNYDGVVLKLKDENNNEAIIPASEFKLKDGVYCADFKGLNATEFSKVVEATFYRGEEAISNTLTFSVESYAYQKQASLTPGLAGLVKSMMRYGASAIAYANE